MCGALGNEVRINPAGETTDTHTHIPKLLSMPSHDEGALRASLLGLTHQEEKDRER